MLKRLLCWAGYHRWQFDHRAHLIGSHYTRYDRCAWCGTIGHLRSEKL